MTDSIIGDMEKKFGEDETAEYIRLAKAVRSLMGTWEAYVAADVGSTEERAIAMAMEAMMGDAKSHPDHTVALLEALVAIILHMRMGGTYEGWFESIGISHIPGAD